LAFGESASQQRLVTAPSFEDEFQFVFPAEPSALERGPLLL